MLSEREIRWAVKFWPHGKRTFFKVGEECVTKIEYHQPSGPGDAHYIDVYFDNGNAQRVFNVELIVFEGVNP